MIREALIAAMMNNKSNNSVDNKQTDALSNSSEQTISETPDINRIKYDWNKFLKWMESKGVKGKPELDKGDLGNKYFKQYIKENPQTSLNESVIPLIRKEYVKLRDEGISEILGGKTVFNLPDVGEVKGDAAKPYLHRYMGHILTNEKSDKPNYVGQHLTQTLFPGAELEEYENDMLVKKTKTDIGNLEDISNVYKNKNQQQTPKKQ